jgi:CheY-like chemotaxis protein
MMSVPDSVYTQQTMPIWLVCEDEKQVEDMVLTFYEHLGVEGLSFASGEEALRWIDLVDRGQHDGELPQLAIIDIHFYGTVNGVDIAQRLRQSPYLHNIVIVLMTAMELRPDEEREVVALTGCDLLLKKPLPSLKDLNRLLFGLVGGR